MIFFDFMDKITKSRRPKSCNGHLDVLSLWLKTKSQIKFIWSFMMVLGMDQWSSGTITGNDSDDLGSIPGKVRFLNLWIFDSYDIFTCSGVYIPQYGLKLSQPPWFGGCRRWINDLAVVGSIPCRQNCGTWSTPWGELKWVRPGQWRS